MAATDTVKVQKTYVDEKGVSTIGVEERTTLPDLAALLGSGAGATVVGASTMVVTTAAPAAAPAAFADLTTAATAYNALRTALINARVLK